MLKKIVLSIYFLCFLPVYLHAGKSDVEKTTVHTQQQKPVSKKEQHKDTEKRTWNLHNADIRAVIKAIASIMHKNFLIDPRVQGQVSIVSTEPLGNKALYQAFLSMLQVLGYAAVSNSGVTKIVPISEAKTQGIHFANGKQPGFASEIVVRVIKIHNGSAQQMIPLVRPLISEQGVVTVYQPSNSLLLVGHATNLQRIANMVHQLDQSIRHRIVVITLHHASADKIATMLTQLNQRALAQSGFQNQPGIAADSENNTIIVEGTDKQIEATQSLIKKLDQSANNANTSTKVIHLNYLKAKDLAPILTKIAKSSAANQHNSSSSNNSDSQVSVESQDSTNTLIISAPPNILNALTKVVTALDAKPSQVLVQAIIAQVDAEAVKNLGIQWGSAGSNDTSNSSFSSGMGIIKNGNLQLILHLISGNSNSNILATPSIVVLNNEKAKIGITQQISIATGSYQNPTNNNNDENNSTPFTSYDQKDVGLTLQVTPQISPNQAVKLKLTTKNGTIAKSVGINGQPIIGSSNIDTSVMVNSNNILVLGGLIQHNTSTGIHKVPFFGDIPLIGKLFQYTDNSNSKKDLIVFIKPIILHTGKNAKQLTQKGYERVRKDQMLQGAGKYNATEGTAPILPPFHHPNDVSLPLPYRDVE